MNAMEHVLNDLKEKLILRKHREMDKIRNLEAATNKEVVLISAGKIIELDHLINMLDTMLNYGNQTKK
jgi:hypothetical protein